MCMCIINLRYIFLNEKIFLSKNIILLIRIHFNVTKSVIIGLMIILKN